MRVFGLILLVFGLISPVHAQDFTLEFWVTHLTILRAHQLVDQFDYEGARELIDSALSIYPDNASLYTERGKVSMVLYEWDTALLDFNTAIDKQRDYAPAYFYRGDLLYTRADRRGALADFEEYLVLESSGSLAEQALKAIASIQIEINTLGG